jgi:hypothetical protein
VNLLFLNSPPPPLHHRHAAEEVLTAWKDAPFAFLDPRAAEIVPMASCEECSANTTVTITRIPHPCDVVLVNLNSALLMANDQGGAQAHPSGAKTTVPVQFPSTSTVECRGSTYAIGSIIQHLGEHWESGHFINVSCHGIADDDRLGKKRGQTSAIVLVKKGVPGPTRDSTTEALRLVRLLRDRIQRQPAHGDAPGGTGAPATVHGPKLTDAHPSLVSEHAAGSDGSTAGSPLGSTPSPVSPHRIGRQLFPPTSANGAGVSPGVTVPLDAPVVQGSTEPTPAFAPAVQGTRSTRGEARTPDVTEMTSQASGLVPSATHNPWPSTITARLEPLPSGSKDAEMLDDSPPRSPTVSPHPQSATSILNEAVATFARSTGVASPPVPRRPPIIGRSGSRRATASLTATGPGLSGRSRSLPPDGGGLSHGIMNLDLDENMSSELRTPQQPDQPPHPALLAPSRRRSLGAAHDPASRPVRRVEPAPTPSFVAPPPTHDGPVRRTHARRQRLATQVRTSKAGFLKTLSDIAPSSAPVQYLTLIEQLQNDGTTALEHADHAFRYINLFFPLSGSLMDAISDPLKLGPIPSSTDALLHLFPGMRQAALVTHRGTLTMKLKFDDIDQLRAARLTGWQKGWLPQYPPNHGPGRIMKHERLDHLVVADVMAKSPADAAQTVMRRLRALSKKDGPPVCAEGPGASESSPGRFIVYIDAYGLESAECIYDCLNGAEVASLSYSDRSRTSAKVWGEGRFASCQFCCRRGHTSGSCTAPSMYLQCDSNGLSDEFCSFIKETLDGASSVFAGTNPRRKGDKAFGFAVFADGILPGALAGAAALYTAGGLSHIPRITKTGGVHACRDCGLLDDDAMLNERPLAHANANSTLCGLHRREIVSGRKSRPAPAAPSRATPQYVSHPQASASGRAPILAARRAPAGAATAGGSTRPPRPQEGLPARGHTTAKSSASSLGLQTPSAAVHMDAPTARTRPTPSTPSAFPWMTRMTVGSPLPSSTDPSDQQDPAARPQALTTTMDRGSHTSPGNRQFP